MNKNLKIKSKQGAWIEGTYKGMWFQAKIFSVGSVYGINGGRVSKLMVCSSDVWDWQKTIVSYDRGWPTDMTSPAEMKELELASELAIVLETNI